jgi:MFS family permease
MARRSRARGEGDLEADGERAGISPTQSSTVATGTGAARQEPADEALKPAARGKGEHLEASATPRRVRGSEVVSWRSAVAALRVPGFALYAAGQLLSGIGTWSQSVAQAWLVLDLTHSPVALGMITMLQTLPLLLFSLFGGVLADRVMRRHLLVATQVALSAQACALGALVATGTVTIVWVGVLAFVLGATNALNNPSQQAFVPELVGTDLVADAVALNSIQFNTARMVGGAVGGLTIAAWGISGALFFNAASFLPILAVLVVIRPAHAATQRAPVVSALVELRKGLDYARSTVAVRRVVALVAVVGLLGFNWQVAVPLIARFVLHRSVSGFGDLMAALGAGSLLGALGLARDRRASERRLVSGGLALGALLVCLGVSRSYPVSLVLLIAGGAAGIVTSITANTRLQLLAPDALRGRVMSIYVLLMQGSTPLGAFILGEIAGHAGLEAALLSFGAATMAGVGSIGLRLPHRRGAS